MKPTYPTYLQHPFPFLEMDVVAKLPTNEKLAYQEQLKIYRDLKNVIDTAFQDGIINGILKREVATKTKCIIKALQQGILPIEGIAEILDVTIEFVLQIKKENNL